uniref:Uncharacterized protein n=1 Tax=viral metagenome TaxID=1070528 RepID=A0A6M3M700_9ZZZZ
MKAEVKNGKLTIEAALDGNPPLSKSGKTRVAVSTNGFINVAGDNGKVYSLNLNLIVK